MRSNPSYALQNLSVYLTSDRPEETPLSDLFTNEPFVKATRENAQHTPFSIYTPPPASGTRIMAELVTDEKDGASSNSKRTNPSVPPQGGQGTIYSMRSSSVLKTSFSEREDTFILDEQDPHGRLFFLIIPRLFFFSSLFSFFLFFVKCSLDCSLPFLSV